MSTLPDKSAQIIDAHTGLIHRVVIACQNPALVPDLEPILKQAQDNGWMKLVSVIRKILAGRRDDDLLKGLDEEDHVIIKSILMGLQNPQTLPELTSDVNPSYAAPGLAAMIYAARKGNLEPLQLLSNMALQMNKAGGDMARLAAIMRPLISGERDMNKLAQGMGPESERLLTDILTELHTLEHPH